MIPMAIADRTTVAGLMVREARADALQLGQQRRRLVGHVEAQQLLDLAGEDDDGDAGRETDRDGEGDVLDVGAEPQEPGSDHHQPGHQVASTRPS